MDESDLLDLSWGNGDKPYSQRFSDHFYSQHDGRAETCHVFLHANNLPERWSTYERFQIAELGFGTGLNFFETWRQWCQHRAPGQHLEFTSFEAYPLEACAIRRAISVWPDLIERADRLAKFWPTLTSTPASWALDPQTTLTLVKAPALEGVAGWQQKAHTWYLDGFTPERNPDMWSQELMKEVYNHTHATGTVATYTSAGWVRRNLISAGFKVQKIPGHGTKRHMLTGVREPNERRITNQKFDQPVDYS